VFSCQICLAKIDNKEYKLIRKSTDNNAKYEFAIKCFNEGDYKKTITLLEDISNAYKGTERSENILYLLSTSHFKKKEYIAAGHHYKTYVNTYLRGNHYTECMFMLAYSYYHQSPEPELDQTATVKAIERFQIFIEAFPYNEQTPRAKELQAEMYEKLALRDLKNAQLYYNLGNYRGNNYRAAVVSAQNALNDYPDSKYKEEYSIIIVRSKYKEAINSVLEKLQQRSEDALDECYYFTQEYPDSKYKKEIEKISDHLKRVLAQFEQIED
jgi:outer membrane protein assembly factor BamD